MAAPGRTRRNRAADLLEEPKGLSRGGRRQRRGRDRFGRSTEFIARNMGTPAFLIGLTVFCLIWMAYNIFTPHPFDQGPPKSGFTFLTLILSLQASYAAPLILLAQNRQDDRDRVQFEQDRQRSERNLDDTEYLAREIVALRLLVRDMASKDFIRTEIRELLEELEQRDAPEDRRADDRRSDGLRGGGLQERA